MDASPQLPARSLLQMADDDERYAVDDEEDQGDQAEEGFEVIKDHVVFLIDAADTMFTDQISLSDGSKTTCFGLALRTAVDFMKSRIMVNSKDEFAVIFYNTEESKNELSLRHVYVHTQRCQPNADVLRSLLDLTEEKFQQEIKTYKPGQGPAGSSDADPPFETLRSGLWTAQNSLQADKASAGRVGSRVVLFSNDEDPTRGQPLTVRQSVFDRAAQLHDMGATLRFFPLVSCLRPFNMTAFWSALADLLKDPEEEDDVADFQESSGQGNGTSQSTATTFPGSASGSAAGRTHGTQAASATSSATGGGNSEKVLERLKALGEFMKRRLQRRRHTAAVRFQVTPQLSIAVHVYNMILEAKKPTAIKLYARDHSEIKPDSKMISEDTGAFVEAQATLKKFEPPRAGQRAAGAGTQGYSQVLLTNEEVSQVKHLRGPGLVLLGTKPAKCLRDHHNISHSSFLRPHEREVQGSITAFKALLDALHKSSRVAICRYVRAKTSQAILVALIPQLEEKDPFGYQITPEGLHLIPLPFKDDLRMPEAEPSQAGTQVILATKEEVAAARAVVEALVYDPCIGGVSNPVLNRHYEVLEALALGEDPPHEDLLVDATRPDVADIDNLAGQQLQSFKALAVESRASEAPAGKGRVTGTKRKATEDLTIAEQYALRTNWHELATENGGAGLKKLTNDDLKVYLRYHKLQISGNKQALVERIIDKETGGAL